MFPIVDTSQWVAERPEALGSKEKVWLINQHNDPPIKYLYKVGRSGTGEVWSEKVSYEIARAMTLPCATYEFAIRNGILGTITERFFPDGAMFIPANMILPKVDKEYDGSLRFKQVRYRLSTSIFIVRSLHLKIPLGYEETCPTIPAAEVFVGYLILDALIGNTDRHHENWGVVISKAGDLHLAPTFDHASSLGRELTEERCHERLATNDSRASVEAYSARAKSAFYSIGRGSRLLRNAEIVEVLRGVFPEATKFWASRAVAVPHSEFEKIIEQVPHHVISRASAAFALRMLASNQKMIREAGLD